MKKRRRLGQVATAKELPRGTVTKKKKKRSVPTREDRTKLTGYGFKIKENKNKNKEDPKIKSERINSVIDIYKTKERDFEVILADPPWQYRKNDRRTKGRGIELPYESMSERELVKLGETVEKIAAKDCVLLMWATCTLLDQAVRMIEAWGFKFVTVFLSWHKTDSRTSLNFTSGMGAYNKICIEYALYGIKGCPVPMTYIPPMYTIGDSVINLDKHQLLLAKRGKIIKYKTRKRSDYLSNIVECKGNGIDGTGELVMDKESLLKNMSGLDNEIQEHIEHLEYLKRLKKARDEKDVQTIIESVTNNNHEYTDKTMRKRKGESVKEYKIVRNVIYQERRRHSEKPKQFHDMIERVFPNTKRIELFARDTVKSKKGGSWHFWGNDESLNKPE